MNIFVYYFGPYMTQRIDDVLELIRNLTLKTKNKEAYWERKNTGEDFVRDSYELQLVNNMVKIEERTGPYGDGYDYFTIYDSAGRNLSEFTLFSADWDDSRGDQPKNEVERNRALYELFQAAKISYEEVHGDILRQILNEIQQENSIGKKPKETDE